MLKINDEGFIGFIYFTGPKNFPSKTKRGRLLLGTRTALHSILNRRPRKSQTHSLQVERKVQQRRGRSHSGRGQEKWDRHRILEKFGKNPE